MYNVIFHSLPNSSFKIIKTLDVAMIRHVYYYKRSWFKIFDTKNDYTLMVLYDSPEWFSNSIHYVSYPTEQRCKNEKSEIDFKKNALNNYIKKIQNEILPMNYEETMFDIKKSQLK
jgi:hypothetical protein